MGWVRIRRFGPHVVAVTLAAVGAMTCGGAQYDRIARTVLALDQGIDALTDRSADSRTILRTVATHLPRGDDSVGAAINRFLERIPADGADFHCDADFVRLRARQELIRIEQRLVGDTEDPREPQACYATPFAVDLTRAPSTVEIYGYDFDLVRPEMFVVEDTGYRDVSGALTVRAHYHLTLRLDAATVRLSRSANTLGLTWGNLIHYAIAVVQPGARLCSCTVEEIPAGKVVEFTPSPLRGAGHSGDSAIASAGWANAIMEYRSNELTAAVCMTATASGAGRVVRSGCTHAFILTIDPDRTIEWLFGRVDGRAVYARRDTGMTELPDSGLIHRWSFSGRDSAAAPLVAIELGKIRLVSTALNACVSPIAYLEARRAGAISPATARGLDAQLSKLNPAIAALRPRFAPEHLVQSRNSH